MCSSETGFNQTGAVLAVGSSCEGSASALLAVISPTRRNWERLYLLNSSSGSESSDSGILCGLSSAREPPNVNVVAVFGWSVETVVTGFILPVLLVTTAAHASVFV